MPSTSVHCFAKGTPGEWEAMCVDFDIAVQGSSFDEVRDLLNAAIESYVHDVCLEDEATAHRLLNRRAPFGVRAKLAVGHFVHQLKHRSNDREYRASFDMPCHV